MNKINRWGVVAWMLMGALLQTTQAQEKEYVNVVNMELIVRVMEKGTSIGGFKKEDFTLLEDGKKRQINGFLEIRRRLAPPPEKEKMEKGKKAGRLFLLFFWINNNEIDVAGAVNHFFSTIYHPGDRVVLSTPQKSFDLKDDSQKDKTIKEFLDQWKFETQIVYLDSRNIIRTIELNIQPIVEIAQKRKIGIFENIGVAVNNFLNDYKVSMEEIKLKRLTPQLDGLEKMIRSLESIDCEKWALFFFQRESVPGFDIMTFISYMRMRMVPEAICQMIEKQLNKIDLEMNTVSDTRAITKEMTNIFMQANIPFYTLLLSPERKKITSDSIQYDFFKTNTVFSSWEKVIQDISKITGGKIMDGDSLIDSISKASVIEDIYYMITYIPLEGNTKRKIDVRVNRPGAHVLCGRHMEMEAPPKFKIQKIEMIPPALLRFSAEDIHLLPEGIGVLEISVVGNQKGNDPPQILLSQQVETEGEVELPVEFPKPGLWNLMVGIKDLFTGQKEFKQIEFNWKDPNSPEGTSEETIDVELSLVLTKAAGYAEKLKKAVFHFICQEEVLEDTLSIETINEKFENKNNIYDEFAEQRNFFDRLQGNYKRSKWLYDYQIIGKNEKIIEKRELMEKNGKKSENKNGNLETLFQSYYSFYIPVTLFSRENQTLYNYRIIEKQKIDNVPAFQVAISPRSESQTAIHGEAWICIEDGSVLKIIIDEKSMQGVDKFIEKTKDKKLDLKILDIHEYGVKKNDIRFPSETSIIESYPVDPKKIPPELIMVLDKDHKRIERSRTYFKYKKYKFFQVEVTEEVKPFDK